MGAHSCVIHPELKNALALLGGKYGRMFPDLPPLATDVGAATSLGRAAHMDATLAVVDAELQNPRIPAGFAILGHFIAHDITLDPSLLAEHVDIAALVNFRAPRLNLECLYGLGPVGNPYLYDAYDADKLLLGMTEASRPDDLPRNTQGRALAGDPRNDVLLPTSQLHVAFLKFHNAVVDWVREQGVADVQVFGEAQALTRWHYQWIVAHEFLPLTVGEDLVADIDTSGRKFYTCDGVPAIPVEFSDAAYRFGHSQITPTYKLNDRVGDVAIFPDCLGSRPLPAERVIDWSWFFQLPGQHAPQPSRRIVASLTHALIDLPEQIVGRTDIPEHHSLASRDLQRGVSLDLPSDEAVARAMGATPLSKDECGLAATGWAGETPLWYYVLKEAEVRHQGERLGEVGGRIVAEVLLGLLEADPGSYLHALADWRPTLPGAREGAFTMVDLLTFAGVASSP